jgi:hypothetical protein
MAVTCRLCASHWAKTQTARFLVSSTDQIAGLASEDLDCKRTILMPARRIPVSLGLSRESSPHRRFSSLASLSCRYRTIEPLTRGSWLRAGCEGPGGNTSGASCFISREWPTGRGRTDSRSSHLKDRFTSCAHRVRILVVPPSVTTPRRSTFSSVSGLRATHHRFRHP